MSTAKLVDKTKGTLAQSAAYANMIFKGIYDRLPLIMSYLLDIDLAL